MIMVRETASDLGYVLYIAKMPATCYNNVYEQSTYTYST